MQDKGGRVAVGTACIAHVPCKIYLGSWLIYIGRFLRTDQPHADLLSRLDVGENDKMSKCQGTLVNTTCNLGAYIFCTLTIHNTGKHCYFVNCIYFHSIWRINTLLLAKDARRIIILTQPYRGFFFLVIRRKNKIKGIKNNSFYFFIFLLVFKKIFHLYK